MSLPEQLHTCSGCGSTLHRYPGEWIPQETCWFCWRKFMEASEINLLEFARACRVCGTAIVRPPSDPRPPYLCETCSMVLRKIAPPEGARGRGSMSMSSKPYEAKAESFIVRHWKGVGITVLLLGAALLFAWCQ